MAFDLSTAKPMSSGFDLSTARPVEESTGALVGRKIKEGVTNFVPRVMGDLQGAGEAALTLATGTVGLGVGALAGAVGYASRAAGRSKLDPGDILADAQQQMTYQPRSEAGKKMLSAIDWAATPVTALGNFAGDVVEGAGGDKYASNMTRNIVPALATAGAVKALPPVAGAIARGAGKVSETVADAVPMVKSAAKTASEFYTPERQLVAAGAHLVAGDVIGASTQAGIALARKAYAKRATETGVAEVLDGTSNRVITPSMSGPAIAGSEAGNALLDRITTQNDYAAIKEAVALQRAEAMAANKARMMPASDVGPGEAAPATVLDQQTPAPSVGQQMMAGARAKSVGNAIVNTEPGVGPAAPKRAVSQGPAEDMNYQPQWSKEWEDKASARDKIRDKNAEFDYYMSDDNYQPTIGEQMQQGSSSLLDRLRAATRAVKDNDYEAYVASGGKRTPEEFAQLVKGNAKVDSTIATTKQRQADKSTRLSEGYEAPNWQEEGYGWDPRLDKKLNKLTPDTSIDQVKSAWTAVKKHMQAEIKDNYNHKLTASELDDLFEEHIGSKTDKDGMGWLRKDVEKHK